MTNIFARAFGASALALSMAVGGFSGAVVLTGAAYAQVAFVPFVILINGVPVTVTSLAQLSTIVASNPALAATIASAARVANPALTVEIASAITSVPGVDVAAVQGALGPSPTDTAGLPTGATPVY